MTTDVCEEASDTDEWIEYQLLGVVKCSSSSPSHRSYFSVEFADPGHPAGEIIRNSPLPQVPSTWRDRASGPG